jgi:opacity protein-like surface antigen
LFGAAAGHYALDLQFSPGDYKPTLETDAVSASVTRVFAGGWALTGSVGAVLSGTMGDDDTATGEFDIQPGFLGAVRASKPLQAESGNRPFISAEVTVSFSSVTTELKTIDGSPGAAARMTALDFMIGATVGYTVGDVWQPYVAPRFFGGPIDWTDGGRDLTGSDRHHYQLGLGSAFLLSPQWTLFLDGSPVGARGITAGVVIAPH